MTLAIAHMLFYGIVAAASPLALTATLAVIRSDRARPNGIAFLTGFVFGTTIAVVLGLLLGQAAVERFGSHDTLEGVLALVLGLALVVAGLRERRLPAHHAEQTGRGGAVLAGLNHVGPGAAFSMAGVLGFGGPKRLILTFLAMTAVSEADLGDIASFTAIVLYLAVATMLVSVLVGSVVIGGRRAAATISRGESWLSRNAAFLRVWLAIGLGVALVLDGLRRVLG